MINWESKVPDINIKEISQLIRYLDLYRAVNLILYSLENPYIAITSHCQEEIQEHLRQSSCELGGLLLGKTYALPFKTDHGYDFVTIASMCIPSENFRNSRVSLEMKSEIWNRARNHIEKGLYVLGWYHSHPDLGAFFSSTDRTTQTSFFNHPYSIGIVIDPVRNESRCYWGANSNELAINFLIIPEGITLP